MNWAARRQHALPPVQALHPRRRHLVAAHRALARGIAANRRGAIEQQPAHLIDIMATVTAATGAKYPSEYKGHAIQPMEGVNLRPALDGRPLNRPRPLFWEHEGNRAVRSGNWKIVSVYPDGVGALRHRRRSRRAQQRRRPASRCRQVARGRVGRVGQADERGSMDRAGAPAVGRRRTGAWRRCGTAGRAGRTFAMISNNRSRPHRPVAWAAVSNSSSGFIQNARAAPSSSSAMPATNVISHLPVRSTM